jgi:putative lipoprotein (rSAM/lipoprotein system)
MAIKKSFIRVTNRVLVALLALFGFSNCDSGVVEYGVPNADYTVKGTVVNKADAKPIKGIRIGFTRSYSEPVTMYGVMPQPFRSNAADTTNVTGNYEFSDNFIPVEGINIYVEDIDGTQNGLYNDTVINVDLKNATKSGKTTNWYEGKFTKVQNIELRPKDE